MKKGKWILIVFLLTFILSIVFSTVSNIVSVKFETGLLSIIILSAVLVVVITFGILFDLIGTAAISGKEATFHALNSKKIKGAKQGIYMIKNSNQISSICNDIVGDVCGIISGSIGAVLAVNIYQSTGWPNAIISVVLAALISSFTVGGKAIFKIVAINNADKIILTVSKILAIFGGNK